jgi:hypothetical protein
MTCAGILIKVFRSIPEHFKVQKMFQGGHLTPKFFGELIYRPPNLGDDV